MSSVRSRTNPSKDATIDGEDAVWKRAKFPCRFFSVLGMKAQYHSLTLVGLTDLLPQGPEESAWELGAFPDGILAIDGGILEDLYVTSQNCMWDSVLECHSIGGTF